MLDVRNLVKRAGHVDVRVNGCIIAAEVDKCAEIVELDKGDNCSAAHLKGRG